MKNKIEKNVLMLYYVQGYIYIYPENYIPDLGLSGIG
jgi:hypothetical protein